MRCIHLLLEVGAHILQANCAQSSILNQSLSLQVICLILGSQLILLIGHILRMLRMALLTWSLGNHRLRFLLRPEILLHEQDLDSFRLLAHILRDNCGLVAYIFYFLRYETTLIILSTTLESLEVAEVCAEPAQFGY